MSDGGLDGQHDFIRWLQACHSAVSDLNANLETVTVCLKNVSMDLNTLIGLMEGRPAGLGQKVDPKSDGS